MKKIPPTQVTPRIVQSLSIKLSLLSCISRLQIKTLDLAGGCI